MTAPTAEAPETADGENTMTLDVLLETIGDVSDDHLAAGQRAVRDRAAELRAKHTAAGLTQAERDEAKTLKDVYAKLTAEVEVRTAAAAEVDDALGGIPGDEPAEAATVADPAPSEPGAPESVTEEPTPAATTTDTAAEPAPVVQDPPAAPTPRLPIGTISRARGAAPVSAPPTDVPKLSIVAAAGDRRYSPGTELSATQLYDSIYDRARSLKYDQGGRGDYITVATLEMPKRPDRHLVVGDEIRNSQKVEAVTASGALTAAGVCAPYTIDYSMQAIGSTARPVRDAFPGYIADRGGVQFRRDVDALGSGPISATGTWTLATDADPGDERKPIWDVPCNDVISAEVQAVTLGLRFSNVTGRFDPEAVAANTQAATIAHARRAEQLLLNSMYAQCTATFQETKRLGATRDLLVAIDKVRAYWRDARRLGDDVPLRVILPHFVLDTMRADLTRALHTANSDYLGEADSTILGWFTRRGITPSWTLDGRPAQTGGAFPTARQGYAVASGSQTIPGFPEQTEFAMFPEGTYVYLDGGSLDVGVVRDQELVQQNRYIQFQETFEGLYRKGIEAVHVVADTSPMGASAGTRDPSVFDD